MRSPALLLCLLAACGGGDDAASPDAARTPDAEPDVIPDAEVHDAEPMPDAMVTANLDCADTAQPATAPDPIVINGRAQVISTGGMDDLQGATLEGYRTGNGTPVATDTSDVDGLFTLSVANGALVPVDGYVKGTATGHLDSYLYPPFPLAASTPETPTAFITPSTLGLLGFVSGTTQSSSLGLVGLLVIDCAGDPVAGATVSVAPTDASTKIVYAGANGIPDTALTSTSVTGLAFVFNVPTGPVVVDASVGGESLDEHTIEVRIGAGATAITQTAVAPGPITP
jgi:hypothetical protein